MANQRIMANLLRNWRALSEKIGQFGYNWIQDQHMMEANLAAGHIRNTQVLGQIGQMEPKQADQFPGTHTNRQSCQRPLRSNQDQTKDQTKTKTKHQTTVTIHAFIL